jgi:hypothetical protein
MLNIIALLKNFIKVLEVFSKTLITLAMIV